MSVKAIMFNEGNQLQVKQRVTVYVLMLAVCISCLLMAVSKIQQELLVREQSISELHASSAILTGRDELKLNLSDKTINLDVLEDTLMNILVPVFETGQVGDELNLAALDVFVASMDKNLSEKALGNISAMIKKNINSTHGLGISESIINAYKMKATEDDKLGFKLDDKLTGDFKFEYQQILALNPNAFLVY